jgi:two-component system LytT family response regulator
VKSTLTVLLVDDEPLARARMRRLLAAHLHVQIVAEAANLGDAVAAVEAHHPDLVFLDVELPDGRGLELFTRCELTCAVVFVTAYEEHALRAFEVNALDYLLKPVDAKRLAQSIERLDAGRRSQVSLSGEDRVALRVDGALQLVALADVAFIESAGDYSEVFEWGGRSWLCAKTMKHWEERLPSELFFRIHRSTLVALRGVTQLAPTKGSTHALRLRGFDREFGVSRSSLKALREALEAMSEDQRIS